MSPQPPRTPPNDRLIDRNRFIPYVDTEVDRRLRAVEAKDGTTVVQQTTTTTPSTGTTPTLGPPAYTAVTSFPVSFSTAWVGQTASQQADPRRLLVVDENNDLGYGAGSIVVLNSGVTGSDLSWYAVVIDPTHSNITAWIYLETDTIVSNAIADNLEPTHLALLPGTIVWSTGYVSGQAQTVYYKRIGIDGSAQGGWAGGNVTRVGDKVWFGAVRDTSTSGHMSYLTASGGVVTKTDVNITGNLGSGTTALFSSSTTPTAGVYTAAGHWVPGVTNSNAVYLVTDTGVSTYLGTPSVFDPIAKNPVVSLSSGFASLRLPADNNNLSGVQLCVTVPSLSTTTYSSLIADEANVVVYELYDRGVLSQVNGSTFAAGFTVRNTSTSQVQSRVYLLSAGGSSLVWSSSWMTDNGSSTASAITPRLHSIASTGGTTLMWSVYARVQTGPSNYDMGLTVYRGTLS